MGWERGSGNREHSGFHIRWNTRRVSVSIFSCTYSAETQRCCEVHEHKGSRVEQETRAFESPLSNGSRSPLSVRIPLMSSLGGQVDRQRSFHWYAYALPLHALRAHSLTDTRGGITSVAIQLNDKGVTDTHAPTEPLLVPTHLPVSSLSPPDVTTIPTVSKSPEDCPIDGLRGTKTLSTTFSKPRGTGATSRLWPFIVLTVGSALTFARST